jgi:hypothetical protein
MVHKDKDGDVEMPDASGASPWEYPEYTPEEWAAWEAGQTREETWDSDEE